MKWSQISIRNKCFLIASGTILVIIIAFASPVRRTLKVVGACELIRQKIEDAKNAPTSIARLEMQVKEWSEEMITDFNAESIQVMLFEESGKIAKEHSAQIRSLKSVSVKDDNDIRLQTFAVDMTGTFKTLLKTLNTLEKKLKYGKVVSVEFIMIKAKGKKNEELHANILIQSVTKI